MSRTAAGLSGHGGRALCNQVRQVSLTEGVATRRAMKGKVLDVESRRASRTFVTV